MAVFTQVLKQSCEGSSMKALPRIVRAGSWVQQCLWTLALFVGLLAMCYQVAGLFIGYFQYSTSVNIAEVQATPPFPDVTVCHGDPNWTFDKLKLALTGEESFLSYLTKVRTFQQEFDSSSMEYMIFESLASINGYMQNVHKIHGKGIQLEKSFIIDCVVNTEWELQPCFEGSLHRVNKTVFVDPMFGMCVTFKAHHEGTKGLDLLLYLDDQQIMKKKTFSMLDAASPVLHASSNAARLVIHPRDSFPDIFLASHTVQAGKKVSVNIEATARSVLSEPYGSCITPEDATRAKDIPGFAINRHGYECYRMCAKDYILQDCQCLDIYYASSEEDRANLMMCGLLETSNISRTLERMQCAERVILDMDDSETMYAKCICPTPCDQFVYEYSAEEMQWPHHTFHLSFYEQYIRNSSFAHKFHIYEDLLKVAEANQTLAQMKVSQLSLIESNFAEVKILNHQKAYFHYTETPLISPEALFGNLGGILNLWAGITFITIIEIIEFVYQLFLSKRNERLLRNSTKKPPPNHV